MCKTLMSVVPTNDRDIDRLKLNRIRVMISSKAAAPSIAFVTGPLALYSCITARVAEGSVGAAKEANNKQNAIIKGVFKLDIGRIHVEMKKNAIRINENAPKDSKNARRKYFRPVSFSSFSEKLLPISKVINARQKLVTVSVTELKPVGIISVI